MRPVTLGAKERKAEQKTERRTREMGDQVNASLAAAQLGIEVPADEPRCEQPCRNSKATVEHDKPQETTDLRRRRYFLLKFFSYSFDTNCIYNPFC